MEFTVPAVLAWVPKGDLRADPQPFRFDIAYAPVWGGPETAVALELRWNDRKLAQRDRRIRQRVDDFLTGQTAIREQVVELAGYGLALVALAVLFPGRRIKTMRRGLSPDILFDETPGALRGVEVAGRTRGGRGALRSLRVGTKKALGKAARLRAMTEVVEAHLSLWCSSPRVSEMFKVKP